MTDYIAAALQANDVAFVLATESHLYSLGQKLRAQGLNIDAAIRQGTYIPLGAFETLSTFMRNGMPDSALLFEFAGDLMKAVDKAGKKDRPRVVTCGECAPLLWEAGNADAQFGLNNSAASIRWPASREKDKHVFAKYLRRAFSRSFPRDYVAPAG